MMQYKRVDDNSGCVVVVECIAVAVASLCGFAGAEASPARRRAHEIVEMMRRRQRRGSTVGRTGPRQQRRQRSEEEGLRGMDPAEEDCEGHE